MKFNTAGIVCEYNPFHFGHKYHIQKTRELTDCKNIVCIMSGSMVQRGECAIFDKWQRARSAIEGGADLVIELPAYYVLQSADIFSYGAVKLLDELKVADVISFGCECGDIDTIKKIAHSTVDADYDSYLKEYIRSGIGYPKASELSLKKCMPDYRDELTGPNNTLAIGYVKALNTLNSKIVPFCIRRDNDYHSDISSDDYKSASEIRSRILNGTDYSSYAPNFSSENIYDIRNAETYILGYLRSLDTDNTASVKGEEDGLLNLVVNSSKKACTIDELISLCTNKRYTVHRIKRYIMSLILNIDYDEEISYARILAIGKNGKNLLKQIKKNSNLDIITKAADYKSGSRMFQTDICATDFASLCSSDISKRQTGRDFKTTLYVE